MLASRMLVILSRPLDGGQAVQTVQSARASALRPMCLRFAMPAALRPALSAEGGLDGITFYEGPDPFKSDPSPLADEAYVLHLMGPYGFSSRWDAALLSTLRDVSRSDALLTACLTPPGEKAPPPPSLNGDTRPYARLAASGGPARAPRMPAEAGAFLPALADRFEDDAVLISRGLPLVCAAAPVLTLVADPAMLFGPTRFFAQADINTLSISAYMAGYTVYALHRPVLWPLLEPPRRWLRRPVSNALPGTSLSRFEQLAGFRYDRRRAGVRTTWGLFNVEAGYPQRLPVGLRLAQRARAARMRLSERFMPLLVTAFIDLPGPNRPVAAYMLRFGFLKAIHSLPLLLYTGGSQERLLRAGFPNTQSYPAASLARALPGPLSPAQRLCRGKPLLMKRALSRQVEFTHAAWVDIDVLPHPVCAEAVPDFSPMMDARVHLATVDGVPDLSFLLVPAALIGLICREAASVTYLDGELKRGFGEEALWERLAAKMPDLFTLHPMPRRGLLFFTAFDPELLEGRLRAQLSGLPPPVAPPPNPAAPSPKPKKGAEAPHES